MRLAVAAMAAAILSGCGLGELEPDPELLIEGPPRAGDAQALVMQRYGMSHAKIWWYGPRAITCKGWGFVAPDGVCSDGVTGENGSIVLWNGASAVHETALTHELAHQRFGDDGHANPGIWGTHGSDYEPGTLVGDTNAALAADGM